MLRKLLEGEIKHRAKKNVVQGRSFQEMREKSVSRYQNRAIETAAVIEELIKLAKELREAQQRGEKLGLTEDEAALYDALEVNDSAVKLLGDAVLKHIAQHLVKAVRNNLTIDWAVSENVRAGLRIIIKRVLRKHGYPPDKQEQATRSSWSKPKRCRGRGRAVKLKDDLCEALSTRNLNARVWFCTLPLRQAAGVATREKAGRGVGRALSSDPNPAGPPAREG